MDNPIRLEDIKKENHVSIEIQNTIPKETVILVEEETNPVVKTKLGLCCLCWI